MKVKQLLIILNISTVYSSVYSSHKVAKSSLFEPYISVDLDKYFRILEVCGSNLPVRKVVFARL